MAQPPKDYSHANRVAATARGALTPMGGATTRWGGSEITYDLACSGCGYNLIGLRMGKNCPECGRLIAAAPKWTWDNLCQAPIGYIRLLGLGFSMMALAIFLSAAALALPIATRVGVSTPGLHPSFYALGIAALWVGGLLIVCRPRPNFEGAEKSAFEWLGLKSISVLTQCGFLVAALLWILVASITGATAGPAPGLPGTGVPAPTPAGASALAPILGVIAWVFAGIGLAGWAPTALLLARYADWASDTRKADLLRYSVFGMVFFTASLVLGYFVPPVFGGLVYDSFWWMLAMGLLACVGMFLWCTIGLAALCNAAAGNAKQALGRDLRMVERMREEAARHGDTLKSAPEIEPPDLTHRVGTPRR